MFRKVLESERIPEQWRRNLLVLIFKNMGCSAVVTTGVATRSRDRYFSKAMNGVHTRGEEECADGVDWMEMSVRDGFTTW